VFLLNARPVEAAIAFVQVNSATPQSPQTSVTVTYTKAQTAGNLNVVVVGWNDSTAQVNTVTDSKGNVYALAVGPTVQAGTASQSIYYAKNIVAAAANGNTVTVTFKTAAAYPDIRIAEYSGVDPNNPVDVVAAAQGTGSPSNSGSVTTGNANDLLVGANLVQQVTTAAGTGYTSRVITPQDQDILEDRIVTATGSYSATATISGGAWIMQMVAFRAASGGGAAPPTVTSITPNSGPTTGGTSVTITGTNFATGATVTFGSAAGTNVVVLNSTTLTVTTPAGGAGAVTVTVTNPGPQSGSLANGFSYVLVPTVTIVSPNSGPASGGTSVTITGTNFGAGATVTFASAAATNVVVVNNTTITATTPAGAPGTVTVTVTLNGQSGSLSNGFTYIAPPTVTSVSPNNGSTAGGTVVTITGTNFAAGASVTFGSTAATSVTVVSSTSITATTPSATSTGAVTVTVTNPGPQSGSLSNGFTYTTASTPTAPGGLTAAGGGPGPLVAAAQGYINSSSLTSHTTAPFDSTGGDAIVMLASSHAGVTFTPIDNFGNTYISISGPTSTSVGYDMRTQVWYVRNPVVGPGHTVTMGLSSAQPLVISVIVTKGSNISSPIDAISLINSDNGTQSANVVTPNITTLAANDLLVGFAKVDPSGSTFQSGTGFTQQAAASSNYLDTETGLAATPSMYNATFTIGTPQTWQSSIAAVASNPNQATLSWTASTETGGTISQYLVERCQGIGCSSFAQIGSTTSTTYNDTGLSASTDYSYRVRAQDTASTFGPYSSVASLTTPASIPSLPGNLTATAASSTQINLTWSSSLETGGSISNYVVSRCQGANCTTFSQIGTPTGTAFDDTGLTASTTYTYLVNAIDTNGNPSPFAIVMAATAQAPGSVSFVQVNSATPQGAQSSVAVTYTNAQTAGNLNVVVVGWNDATAQIRSVTDSVGNTYNLAVGPTVQAGTATQAIYYAKNIAAAAANANTVTVTFSPAANTPDIRIAEYSGIDQANPLDVVAAGQGNGSPSNSGSVTTGSLNDLLVGANLVQELTLGAGPGYIGRIITSTDSDILEDQVVTTSGSYSATANISGGAWIMQMVAFRAAGSGVGTSPIISSLSPNFGPVGTAVTITGTNFGSSQGTSTVTFNGVPATVTTWNGTSIAVSVPSGATTGSVFVTVSGVASNGITFTVSPMITNLSPTSGPPGTVVTIAGSNFGYIQGTNSVTFNGVAATVTTWTPGIITASVPNGSTTGSVVVTVNGIGSNGVSFTAVSLFVSLSPKRAAVTLSQTAQFTATVNNDPLNGGASWSVDGVAGGNSTVGTISSGGLFTPGTQPGVHTVTATSNSNGSASASSMIAVTDLTGVLTYHYDPGRSGQNLQEYALTPSTVNPSTFGPLFTCSVQGYVYAAPLYLANFNLGGKTRNVVFIATEHDIVYAFDADSPSCVQLWSTSFLSSGVTTVPAADTGAGTPSDLTPEIGITSTPVIDPSSNTLYVEAKTKETVGSGCSTGHPCYIHRLHALDATTGMERPGSPVVLTAPNFVSLYQLQRPALLLANGTIYIGFGSHGDFNVWQGWLMAYNASTLAQEWVWHSTDPTVTSGNGNMGAIWGAGNGPALDSSGNIYVETGNGVFDGATNFADSVVKLSPSGTMLDYFTPFDQAVMQQNDIDLGSSGPIVLPSAAGSSSHPDVMIATGKVGVVYLLDQNNMGKYNTAANQDLGEADVGFQTSNPEGGFYGQPAYWNGNIYTAIVGDNLRQYSLSNGQIATTPTASSPNAFLYRGATPSVSASGSMNGIVWVADITAYQAQAGGAVILDAYDATNVSNLLYSSPSSGSGAAVPAAKFTVPTVANGKVYVVGQQGFTVFGLLPN
jgi:hypothetical protein